MNNHIGTVAVIDDDPGVLDSLKFLLESAGHFVAAYSSAVAFLADCGTPPDRMILDQHMPEITGLELAGTLRNSRPATPSY